MRPPLIRPGGGPDEIHRIYEDRAREAERVRRMIDTATSDESQQQKRRRGLVGARSPAGDEDRLRAIPVSVEGVAGVIPGTQPEAAAIRHLGRTT